MATPFTADDCFAIAANLIAADLEDRRDNQTRRLINLVETTADSFDVDKPTIYGALGAARAAAIDSAANPLLYRSLWECALGTRLHAIACTTDDECYDPATGVAYPRGRCDTCGAPCTDDPAPAKPSGFAAAIAAANPGTLAIG